MKLKLILVFFFASIIIIFFSLKNEEVINCTAEYQAALENKTIFTSISIKQKDNKGYILIVADYKDNDAVNLPFKISRTYSYDYYDNIFHLYSDNISVSPKSILKNIDIINILPIFFIAEKSEIAFSIKKLDNDDIIIYQGLSPVLYCKTNP